MSNEIKINDLSGLRDRFKDKAFVPTTNLAVAMIRVSTKQQKGDAHYSDQEQRDTISPYLEKNGLHLEKAPWDIAETASKHDERKGFLEMVDFIEESQKTSRPVKHVIFSHQSRAARNRKSARILEELLELGVVIHFARENRKITCQSDLAETLVWNIENVRNEQYIVEHTKNVWGGMVAKMEDGGYPGHAPYGYLNHRPSPKSRSIFILDGERAEYMKVAFELCATGLYSSIQQLSSELDKRFSHLSGRPRMKRLYSILRNPFYYGDFRWKEQTYKGNPEFQPPITSYDLWKRVQNLLDGRSKYRKTTKQFHYLNLIKCGGHILDERGYKTDEPCACSLTAEEKRKKMKDGSTKLYYYYHCSNTSKRCSQRDKFHMQSAAGRKTVNYQETEIEVLFETVFRPFKWTPELVQRMQEILRAEHAQKSGDHKQQVASLRRRYEMLQTYMDKAYDDKLAGDLTPNEWREKNERWKQEREETKMKIDALDSAKDEYIENGVLLIELAQHSEILYKEATPEEKRQLVEIVSSNRVLKDGSIEITYRKPFDLLAASDSESKWWSLVPLYRTYVLQNTQEMIHKVAQLKSA